MNKVKILIIEDEEILLDVLTTKLNKEGFDVETAKNGEEGIAKLRNLKPDLVLLDIIMPKMDGYEVLEMVHNDKELKTIPIIIISNSGQPVEIDRALSLGAVDYLIKAQFEPEEVITKVKKALKTFTLDTQNDIPSTKTQFIKSTNTNKKKTKQMKRILIIEDDQFLRELICRKLTHDGYGVSTAIDGKEGFEKIIKEKPDLVLLDIILPVQDGFDVLKQVRTHHDKSINAIPIFLLSNLGQDTDIEKGKRLGANDYLVKASFTTDQIVEKIKKLS